MSAQRRSLSSCCIKYLCKGCLKKKEELNKRSITWDICIVAKARFCSD